MEEKGAALVAREGELDENELAKTLARVINNEPFRLEMGERMRALSQPHAADKMIQAIERQLKGF